MQTERPRDRDDFITRSEERLDLLEAQLEQAADELKARGAGTRTELTARMRNARRCLLDARVRLEQARSTMSPVGDDLARDVDAAFDDAGRTARQVLEDLRV